MTFNIKKRKPFRICDKEYLSYWWGCVEKQQQQQKKIVKHLFRFNLIVTLRFYEDEDEGNTGFINTIHIDSQYARQSAQYTNNSGQWTEEKQELKYTDD